MNGMKDCAVVSAVVVAIYSFVVTAEVYRFHSNGAYPSAYCYDYVTNSGSAATNIACADKCGRNNQCQGFVYDSGSMLCTEIGVINNKYPDRRCQAGGTRFFAKEAPACDQYLVGEAGTGGVDDSQLTESSSYCPVREPISPLCLPVDMKYGSAWYARLSSRGAPNVGNTGGWAAGYLDEVQWVQVEFHQPMTVSSVVLTATDPNFNSQYVTSFRFLYSDDCSYFEEFEENGASMVLQGNSGAYEIVTRPLPERVRARCFRINPRSWNDWISLRFDLEGCP